MLLECETSRWKAEGEPRQATVRADRQFEEARVLASHAPRLCCHSDRVVACPRGNWTSDGQTSAFPAPLSEERRALAWLRCVKLFPASACLVPKSSQVLPPSHLTGDDPQARQQVWSELSFPLGSAVGGTGTAGVRRHRGLVRVLPNALSFV